ncbi:MAG: sigma-70 family RNA polymerase sigma factor [Clostridia bacterium]|nr:sigma-70 family RNA polymerase sigma factor [Clostridia bacterium]
MEDSEIVQLYWNRIETAILETSLKYGKYCRKIAFNILSNDEDAEECVNDTYLKAWNSIPPNKPFALSSYLGKITRNLSLNKYKQSNAKKRGNGEVALALDELQECIPAVGSIEQELENDIIAQAINCFLWTLEKVECNIYLRRYWYLDSISAISEQYKISKSKVKSMLYRTRKKMRCYLEKEGITL